MREKIGASILNVITESLYEKPIAVFREYVQNSVDAFGEERECKVEIWSEGENVFFLDNGSGITRARFDNKMRSIGASGKIRKDNIGYKGIGRLSGIAYCKKLQFVNICNKTKGMYQVFTIDCEKYRRIKEDEEKYANMGFDELMSRIGRTSKAISKKQKTLIEKALRQRDELFINKNTGFLVILYGITSVLNSAMNAEDFVKQLSWLLPVPFSKELLDKKRKDIDFNQFITWKEDGADIAVKSYSIRYQGGDELKRPIDEKKLRDYCTTIDMTGATGFISFNLSKFTVANNNDFKGVRLYIKNTLLCDEREIAQILIDYGLTTTTLAELINTMRNVGVVIYIVDKNNFYENARRTFIEIEDGDSLTFIRELSELVNRIYDARYALSRYRSGIKKYSSQEKEVDILREKAETALDAMINKGRTSDGWGFSTDKAAFEDLNETDKKQIIKQVINKRLGERLRQFMANANGIRPENAYDSFIDWIISNR